MDINQRPLSRQELEAILERRGAWRKGKQTRPLTREDVLEVFRANGGSGARLDFSNLDLRDIDLGASLSVPVEQLLPVVPGDRSQFEGLLRRGPFFPETTSAREHTIDWRADFSDANLSSCDLQGAVLWFANLERANLVSASLQGATLADANLCEANLQEANLERANLENADLRQALLMNVNFRSATLRFCNFNGANLFQANVEDADLRSAALDGARLSQAHVETALLEGIKWGHRYLVPEEEDGRRQRNFRVAAEIYRSLKSVHASAGIYPIADQFAYREQVCNTRELWLSKKLEDKAKALFQYFFVDEVVGFGYGYRPWRVWRSGAIILIGFSLVYWLAGLYSARGVIELGKSTYFSAVSFTAVGYGAWVSTSGTDLGWPKYLGVLESFIGVFYLALFLVTFSRQWLR